MKEYKKATIYLTGEFFGNVQKVEVRDLKVWIGKYAQHNETVHLQFIPKGKRKARATTITPSHPFGLIFEGWNLGLEPGDPMTPTEVDPVTGVGTRRSLYSGHDPRWRTDFLALVLSSGLVPEFDLSDVSSWSEIGSCKRWRLTREVHGGQREPVAVGRHGRATWPDEYSARQWIEDETALRGADDMAARYGSNLDVEEFTL